MVPIFTDIMQQGSAAKRFAVRLVLFLALLILADRLLGIFLTRGLERYFGLDRPAEVLAIGHSLTVLGLDHTELEKRLNLPVAKYARQGAKVADRLAMLQHYLECQPDSVRMLIYGVDPYIFTESGLSANSYRLFFPFMNRKSVRDFLRGQCRRRSEYQLRIAVCSSRFNEETMAMALRGWLKNWANLKRGTVNVKRLKQQIAERDYRKIRFDEDSIRIFSETIRLARENGIEVILTFFPTLDLLNQTQPEEYKKTVQMLEGIAEGTPGVHLLNYNPEFAHRHELFYDPIHLNPEGRKIISERLAENLRNIINIQQNHEIPD